MQFVHRRLPLLVLKKLKEIIIQNGIWINYKLQNINICALVSVGLLL